MPFVGVASWDWVKRVLPNHLWSESLTVESLTVDNVCQAVMHASGSLSATVVTGCLYSTEWNDGMERWNGME